MDSSVHTIAFGMAKEIGDYLPSLFAGLVLLAVGLVVGWVAKRVVTQVCILLRLDRLLPRFSWGADFAKADVRHTLYRTAGNLAFLSVLLFFLNAALNAMGLKLLSGLIERGALFLPRLLIATLVAIFGWVVSDWGSSALQRALAKEEVPRASLIARFAKAMMLLFFLAMAFVELDVAREVVVIGFTVVITTLGALAVVLVAVGGKGLARSLLKPPDDP